MKVMLHKNRGTHMKNHKVEKGCILAALLFVLLWIGGSFPVNAKETGAKPDGIPGGRTAHEQE